MSDQELCFKELEEEEGGGFESGTFDRLSTLRLEDYRRAAIAGDTTPPYPSIEKCCRTCGGSLKRRSPSSSSLEQPTTKKPTLQPSAFTTPPPAAHLLAAGYTKLPLPTAYPITAAPSSSDSEHPAVFRNFSDKINCPGIQRIEASSVHFLDTQSPEKANIENLAKTAPRPLESTSVLASLPPLPPNFRHSVSDPSSAAYVATNTTPPLHPSSARTLASSKPISIAEMHQDSVKKESPNAKRLKRMKDRMREISQTWDQLIRESQEEEEENVDDCVTEDNKETDLPKYETDDEEEEEVEVGEVEEEAVWVERIRECLSIHFKCPCGMGYNILLSGSDCYYKLSNLTE